MRVSALTGGRVGGTTDPRALGRSVGGAHGMTAAGELPAAGVQDPLPGQAVARLAEDARQTLAGAPQLRRQVLVQEGPDLSLEGEVLLTQLKVHGDAATVRSLRTPATCGPSRRRTSYRK